MKYKLMFEETMEYMENNYKGSEITIELIINYAKKLCNSEYCLK